MQKIIVAGLLPVQNQEVARRYGKQFDIRFITTDSSPAAWERAGKSQFEHVFLTTKFISHCHQEAFPRDKVIYVNGSLSAMCRELEKHIPLSRRDVLPPLPPEEEKEHSAPTTNIMLDFAHRNGLLEDPVVETPVPIAHQVFDLLARRAVGSTLSPKELTKLLGLPDNEVDCVNTAMAKAQTKGYLERASRGVYRITDKTTNVGDIKGTRKQRNPAVRLDAKDPVLRLEATITNLLELVEMLKKTNKFDITQVSNKVLYAEVARRNTK